MLSLQFCPFHGAATIPLAIEKGDESSRQPDADSTVAIGACSAALRLLALPQVTHEQN
jgi:hypothetical protein